jgi:predicted DNA-binding transcriptional regulator AlpA
VIFYFGMIIKFPEQQCKATPAEDENATPTRTHFTGILTYFELGLARTKAAAYIGVSPSLFDQMVADGRMPKPKTINARTVWDRREIEAAFTALPHRNDGDKRTDNDDDEWRTAV